MMDVRRQYLALKPQIDAALSSVFETAAFIRGDEVGLFETELSDYLGVRHVVSCGSGTDALQIAFMALGISLGDEVITTPFTFVATVEALVLLGARPVFVDIDPRTYNLDVKQVEARITERTRALVPVHLYGLPADMESLMAIASRYKLPIVEDSAQSMGARYGNHLAGTMGKLGCFSFFPAKNLGCFGDGGAVVTDDDALADRCRLIANHGSRVRYHHETVGINSRLDTIQAAVLRVKLPHVDASNEARRRIAARYDEAFEPRGILTPIAPSGCTHVYQQYTIRCRQRGLLAQHLASCGVPHAIHYPRALHQQPAFSRLPSVAPSFPHAEAAAEEVLSLPLFPEMTSSEVEQVIAAVSSFSESPLAGHGRKLL